MCLRSVAGVRSSQVLMGFLIIAHHLCAMILLYLEGYLCGHVTVTLLPQCLKTWIWPNPLTKRSHTRNILNPNALTSGGNILLSGSLSDPPGRVRAYVHWHLHNKHKRSMYKPDQHLTNPSCPYQLELLRIWTHWGDCFCFWNSSLVPCLKVCVAHIHVNLSRWFLEFLPESNRRPRDWQSRALTK